MDKGFLLKTFLFQGGGGMALFLNWVTGGAKTSGIISFSTQKIPDHEVESPGWKRRKFNMPWRDGAGNSLLPWSWLGFVHLGLLHKEFGFLRAGSGPISRRFSWIFPDFTIPGCLSLSGCVWPRVSLVLFHSSSRKIHPSFQPWSTTKLLFRQQWRRAVKIPLHGHEQKHRKKQMSVV